MTPCYRIKDWEKFQHFKDRRPPWIKLYRDILEDPDWFALDPKHAKALVMLWLLASEDNGNLPCISKIAFRLRMKETEAKAIIIGLEHWVCRHDISLSTERYHDDTPERAREETERETEREVEVETKTCACESGFEAFWKAYPKKKAKGKAEESWKKLKASDELKAAIMKAVEVQRRCPDWIKDGGKYIPFPATWLNQKRWEDEPDTTHAGEHVGNTRIPF